MAARSYNLTSARSSIYSHIMSTFKRKCFRTEITKTRNVIDNTVSTLNKVQLESKLLRLSEIKENISLLNDQCFDQILEDLDENASDAPLQVEHDSTVEYADKLDYCIALIKDRLYNIARDDTVPNANVAAGGTGNFTNFKKPPIPLPTYGHKDGDDLNKFFHKFEFTIDKLQLNNMEKYVYLLGQLSGEPLSLISNMHLQNQTTLRLKSSLRAHLPLLQLSNLTP